ncbi:hypothetical protein HZH68_005245 [Vespula germanica]|uniref:Uncharacterized protein n=1 Tax=Vespula germanica TaxID=30212 RepID=A0A834KFM5_VESGE|nr:hypothetical protein HZH68_005245 [Vespula germanica]
MKRSVPEWLSLLPAALSDSDAAAAAAVVVAVAVTVASSLDRRKSQFLGVTQVRKTYAHTWVLKRLRNAESIDRVNNCRPTNYISKTFNIKITNELQILLKSENLLIDLHLRQYMICYSVN